MSGGVAVIWVMIITTCLMVVVMLIIGQTNTPLIIMFFTVFIFIEGLYMTSLLGKVPQGGWVPFLIGGFFLTIMLSWTYGRNKKNSYKANMKLSKDDLTELILTEANIRVPGICFFYIDLINGIPPIIRHYLQHVRSLREVMVILTLRTLPIRSVLLDEWFLGGRLGPRGVYRCLVQYGYMDNPNMIGDDFIAAVVDKLREMTVSDHEEMQQLDVAASHGVVYVMGKIVLLSSEKYGVLAHIVIDYFYRFL